MSRKLHTTLLFRAGCCLLAVCSLCLLIGCDGVAGKKPPSLTQTVSLGGSGTILFPAGSQQKIKEDKPHFVAFGPMIMSHTEGAHLVAKGFTYEAACLWIDDNRGELDIFRLGLHDFANPFGCRIHETLADKTKVYEMIGMSRDNAPQSVRIVTAPDGRNYISFFKYKESTVPTAAQIEHEKKFHHSLKVNGRLIEDTLNDDADELYALRTAPPEKPEKSANQEPEEPPGPFIGTDLGFSANGEGIVEQIPEDEYLVGFAVTFKRWENNSVDSIESVQPLYRSRDGLELHRGKIHGNANGKTREVVAPDGYAVGKINGQAALVVDAFELVCMKIKPDGSLDPNDTQTLPWVGNSQGGMPFIIDGQGQKIIKISSRHRDFLVSLKFYFDDSPVQPPPTQSPQPPPTVTIDDTKLGNSTDGTEFSEKTPNNGVLVGFAVTFDAFDCIESVQPLYRSLTGTGTKRGNVYGNAVGEPKPVFAPTGYAVGGLNGRAGTTVDGFELVCMKIMPDGSLDPTDTMTLPWVGNNDPGGRRTAIDGEGKPVTEIKGYTRDHVSSLELVFE